MYDIIISDINQIMLGEPIKHYSDLEKTAYIGRPISVSKISK